MAMEPHLCRENKTSQILHPKQQEKPTLKEKIKRKLGTGSIQIPLGVFISARANPEAMMLDISGTINEGMPLLSSHLQGKILVQCLSRGMK